MTVPNNMLMTSGLTPGPMTDAIGIIVALVDVPSMPCTAPPVITGAAVAGSSVLWPPNHKMVPFTINYTVTDGCNPSSSAGIYTVLSVSSNQPINATGDGNTSPDWQILDAHHLLLRAERAGNIKTDRVYTITITATNSNGSTTSTVQVTVPHN